MMPVACAGAPYGGPCEGSRWPCRRRRVQTLGTNRTIRASKGIELKPWPAEPPGRGLVMRTWLLVVYLATISAFSAIVLFAMVSTRDMRAPDPLIAIVPFLMLADYYSTLLYASRVKRSHKTVALTDVELNPMWKADVARLRLVNFRHLAGVLFVSVVFLLLSQGTDAFYTGLLHVLLGCLTVCSGMQVARNSLNAFIIGRSSERRTTTIAPGVARWLTTESGQSSFFGLVVLALLGISSAFASGWFALGGLAGLVFERAVRAELIREAAVKSCGRNAAPPPRGADVGN